MKRFENIGAVIVALVLFGLISLAAYAIKQPILPSLLVALTVGALLVIAIGISAVCYRACKYRGRIRTFANIAEGVHGDGRVTKKATAAIATRYLLCKLGADADHIAVSTVAGEKCHFVCTDEPAAADDYVEADVLGCADGTIRMVCGGAVTFGDALESVGNGKVQPINVGANHYEVGTALQSGVLNDVIEVAHCHPIHRPT